MLAGLAEEEKAERRALALRLLGWEGGTLPPRQQQPLELLTSGMMARTAYAEAAVSASGPGGPAPPLSPDTGCVFYASVQGFNFLFI